MQPQAWSQIKPHESAVSQASRRLTLKIAKDGTLRRKIQKLEDGLRMSRV